MMGLLAENCLRISVLTFNNCAHMMAMQYPPIGRRE